MEEMPDLEAALTLDEKMGEHCNRGRGKETLTWRTLDVTATRNPEQEGGVEEMPDLEAASLQPHPQIHKPKP